MKLRKWTLTKELEEFDFDEYIRPLYCTMVWREILFTPTTDLLHLSFKVFGFIICFPIFVAIDLILLPFKILATIKLR